MKNSHAVPLLTLLFGLLMIHGSLRSARAQLCGKTPATGEPRVSVNALTGSIKQRFDRIVGSGFRVTYRLRGKTITASATGKKLNYLRSKKEKLDDRSVLVKAVTNDGALEITTYFTVDEAKQKLMIDRRIRNTSATTVIVRMIGEYLDPKTLGGGQGSDLKRYSVQTASTQIRAGQLLSLPRLPDRLTAGYFADCGDCPNCECTMPPKPCTTVTCPSVPKYTAPRLHASASDAVVLKWNRPTTLASRRARSYSRSTANETRVITELDLR